MSEYRDAFIGSPLSKRGYYQKIRAGMMSTRTSYESQWRELAEYIAPRRTRFFAGDRNRGDKRNQSIIDSTARFSARTLQSGLHAGLTSPARPWFKLTTPDPELAENKPVKEWLHVVTQRMQTVFADTNLYNVLPIIYGDMGVFGTACASMLEDSQDLFRCYSYPIGSYALGLNARGTATSFVNDYSLSVRQVVEEFGVEQGRRDIAWDRISVTVKNQWDLGNYESPVEICWVVIPNIDADDRKLDSRHFPWTSCHFEMGENREGRFLRESGFRSFPILAPRWDITGGDTYGTDSPGMTALGDVKQLQLMQKEKAKAIRKMVDPPLIGAAELRTQKTSLLPGDITYVREPQHGLRSIHEINLNLADLRDDIGATQYRIQRAFYEDLFLMLARSDEQRDSGQPITAREVQERHEEKLLALGPVLERTNDELLDPLIDRCYQLMDRAGLLPDPPEALTGVKLKVEYISIMAQAQKLVGVVGQDRFVMSLMPMMQEFPEIRHKININQIIDNYGEMLGVDPRILRSNEEADASAAAQAQAQQAHAAAEQAQMLGRAVKDTSQAKLGTDSALDRIAGAASAGSPPGTPQVPPPPGAGSVQ